MDDGLELRFPEGTFTGHAGFRAWYKAVTTRFFDEVHEVRRSRSTVGGGPHTCQGRRQLAGDRLGPTGTKSGWLGFDAYQTWELVAGGDGSPQIRTYIVDALEPMPGSASL